MNPAVKEKRKKKGHQNQGETDGEQRRGLSCIKEALLLMKEEGKGEKRAREKLLLASWTQCQTQSVSGPAARLVSQAPAHNGGEGSAATPLTSNLHPPGRS